MQIKKKTVANSKAKTKPKIVKKRTSALPAKKRVVGKVPNKKTANAVKLPPEFTMKQVKQIVALIKDAGNFTTFGYKTDEFEIEISVGMPSSITPNAMLMTPVSAPSAVKMTASGTYATPALTLNSAERVIISPMIGTFFRRPSPSSPPFVEVGDAVSPGMDVCIVEVMKLLNTIPAECAGRVSRILVEDGENIEAGQALMVIEVS